MQRFWSNEHLTHSKIALISLKIYAEWKCAVEKVCQSSMLLSEIGQIANGM